MSAADAPLRVPVEIRHSGRWYRLAQAVSPEGLLLGRALPDEIEGPVEVKFHLPEDPSPVRCQGRLIEVEQEGGEGVERRGVRFLDVDEATRLRIARYVRERAG